MKTVCSLSLLLCLLGCHAKPSTRTVALLDVSGSIYPEEVDREFAEMQTLAAKLQRGDQLILIPITGNARNDTPGHIVRLSAPDGRTTFDTDLVAYRQDAEKQIGEMKDWAKHNPARRTDIFGTLAVAQPDLQIEPNIVTKLDILSDFLEDDGTWNFSTDRRLTSKRDAEALLRANDSTERASLSCVAVRLERLQSRDGGALSSARLAAVDAFWNSFTTQSSR